MTPREVVPCHHSLVPNWKLFQPCSKEHWVENHLRKKRVHTSCSHLCWGALGPAGAVVESVLWWIQNAWTCLLRGAGFACLPLHSARGSGRDDPTAAAHWRLEDAHVLVTFYPHSITARLGHISAQEWCLCQFSSVPTTLPTSRWAQEAAGATKENRNQILIGEIAFSQKRSC